MGIEGTKDWLDAAIRRAFQPGSYQILPDIPTGHVGKNKAESKALYGWSKCLHDGYGPVALEGEISFVYPETFSKDLHYSDLYTPSFQPQTKPPGPKLSQNQPATIVSTRPQQLLENFTAEGPWLTAGPSKKPSTSRATSPASKGKKNDQQTWVLRFPKDRSPQKRDLPHMNPHQIVDALDVLRNSNKALRFIPVATRWTPAGNINIMFSNTTKPENVKIAAVSIISRIDHGIPDCIFSQAASWSKIAISRVPIWWAPTSEEEIIPTDEEGNTLHRPWSNDEILAALQKNQVLKNLRFELTPSWAKNPATYIFPKDQLGTISILFEDPDGAISKMICDSQLFLFGQPVACKAWKEKKNLNMCPRCLQFGRTHPNCKVRCLYCGSTEHDQELHNASCLQCIAIHGDQEVLDECFICPHLKCVHCSAAHAADSDACPKRNEGVIEAQGKNKTSSNQPTIDGAFDRLQERGRSRRTKDTAPTPIQPLQPGGTKGKGVDRRNQIPPGSS